MLLNEQTESKVKQFLNKYNVTIRLVLYVTLIVICFSLLFVEPLTALLLAVQLVVFSSIVNIFSNISRMKTF